MSVAVVIERRSEIGDDGSGCTPQLSLSRIEFAGIEMTVLGIFAR